MGFCYIFCADVLVLVFGSCRGLDSLMSYIVISSLKPPYSLLFGGLILGLSFLFAFLLRVMNSFNWCFYYLFDLYFTLAGQDLIND